MEQTHVEDLPEATLGQRLSKGVSWVASARVFLQLVGFVRIIVIAHLLGPDDYGLFGISLLALSVFDTISRTGLETALVQRRGDVTPHLDTVWTVQVLRGAILTAALFFAAGPIASFFREPRSHDLIQAMAFVFLLRGLTNVAIIQRQRSVDFKPRALMDISSTTAELAVSLGLALLLQDAAALVIGALAGSSVSLVLSYAVVPRRPRLALRLCSVRALQSFAGWTWVHTLAKFTAVEGDDILVGRMLGADVLGLYRMAYRLSNLVTTEVTDALTSVMLPAHAELSGQPGRNKELFLTTLRFVGLVSVPATILLIVTAPDLTGVLLGAEWAPMVLTMQLLALWGLDRSLIATVAPVLLGQGDARGLASINILRVAGLAVLVYPLTVTWQTEGTAVAVIGSAVIADSYGFWRGFRAMDCGLNEAIGALMPAVVAGVFMAVTALFLLAVMPEDALPRLIVIGFSSTATYLAACVWLGGHSHLNMRTDVARFLKGWAH